VKDKGGIRTIDAGVPRLLRRWATAEDPTAGAPLDDLTDLSPAESTLTTPDGAALALSEAGPRDGALFVLAHCWTGDRRVWGPVARRLVQAGHRVVRYDHRGHGRSTVGSAPLALETLADDLALVLDRVAGDDRAVVAGHSMGGMTIQALAGSRPDVLAGRAGSAVLVSTSSAAVLHGTRGRFGPRVVAHPRVGAMLGRSVLGPWTVRSFVGRRPCLAHLQAVTETFTATDGAVRGRLLQGMTTMDLAPGLARLAMPVTVVVGGRDRHTPPAAARRIAGAVPGSKLVEVPDAGHMLPFEAPDLLARELLVAAGAARLVTSSESAPAGERSL